MRTNMKRVRKMLLIATAPLLGASTSWADTLPTHRIPAELAVEAANETVAACARQGYRETAVVLDADGAIIVTLRGDGAGIHSLDSAHYLLSRRLLREGVAAQVNLNVQLFRLIGQLLEQLGIRELRDIAWRFLGANIEHLAQFSIRPRLAVELRD